MGGFQRDVQISMNKIVKRISTDRQLRDAVLKECEREGDPITVQAINEWRKLQKGVPPKRAAAVSRATGLPLHMIRPDIFPRPPRARAS
jgi:hypothetical protein